MRANSLVVLSMAAALVAPSLVGHALAQEQGKASQADQKVNPEALVLVDFAKRIEKYLDVRKQAVKEAPSLKETSDASQIKAAEDTLAQAIRTARATAQPGDIFTPEIRDRFRHLLYPELKGEAGKNAKEILKDDAPPTTAVAFKINAKYPDGTPLPTVPAALLANLPTLPKELEYRIIGTHLILRDTRANIIVDYMRDVIR